MVISMLILFKVNNPVCFRAIARYKIASLVPLGGDTTFENIAKQTGVEDRTICRLLRHAITMRVFCEPEPGVLAHTQASKALNSSVVNDWLSCGTEEMWPASEKVRLFCCFFILFRFTHGEC